jgi:hypothetical protein
MMKKTWVAPKLTVHGTIEEITKGGTQIKSLGPGDDLASNIQTRPPGTPLS